MRSSAHCKRGNIHCPKPVNVAEWLDVAGSAFSQEPAVEKFWHRWCFGIACWYRVWFTEEKNVSTKRRRSKRFTEAELFTSKLIAGDDFLMWPQDRQSSFYLLTNAVCYHVVYF